MKYNIEGSIKFSETPTEVLIDIIKHVTQSIKQVAKVKFPEESEGFEVFITGFSNESLGIEIEASHPSVLEESFDLISRAFARKGTPTLIPKRAYNAFRALETIAIERGGAISIYNSRDNTPLFQFSENSRMPDYSPEKIKEPSFIEEQLTTLGKIYRISGEETPSFSIKLLNGQKFKKTISREQGIALGKWLFQWVDVSGLVKRKTYTSTKFDEFIIKKMIPNPNGDLIARVYQEMVDEHHSASSKEKARDAVDFDEFLEYLRGMRLET